MDDETAAQEAVDGLDGVFFSGGTIKVEVCFIQSAMHVLKFEFRPVLNF